MPLTTPTRRKKRTPWYPPHIKPVRDGYYEATLFPNMEPPYAYPVLRWNGKWWVMRNEENIPSMSQERHWRGLARKP